MARRKDRTRQARGTAVPVFRTATYARLSVDSGTAGSDSIASQQMLMRDFLKGKEEFALVREYKDDGVSGTRFDRQALECLLSDVRKGKINCIVVKDFSRFGRDHIEVGNYLEKVFPFPTHGPGRQWAAAPAPLPDRAAQRQPEVPPDQ